jgi:hypothetical protein
VLSFRICMSWLAPKSFSMLLDALIDAPTAMSRKGVGMV